MKKFKYLKVSKAKKLRYIDNLEKNCILFFFQDSCLMLRVLNQIRSKNMLLKKNLVFGFRIYGTRKIFRKFTDGNISIWTQDSKRLIKKIVKQKLYF